MAVSDEMVTLDGKKFNRLPANGFLMWDAETGYYGFRMLEAGADLVVGLRAASALYVTILGN